MNDETIDLADYHFLGLRSIRHDCDWPWILNHLALMAGDEGSPKLKVALEVLAIRIDNGAL